MVPAPASPKSPPSAELTVEPGDVVSVRYTGTLANGEVFDTNIGPEDEPLEFEVGAGEVIPGFESAVIGMRKGESKKVHIPVDEAYGAVDEELIQKVPKDEFGDTEVEPDMQVDLEDDEGNHFVATILEVDEEGVTIDLNHPLAGEALNFEITVVGVQRS